MRNNDQSSNSNTSNFESAAQAALEAGLGFLQKQKPEQVLEVLRPVSGSATPYRDIHCLKALALFQLNRFHEGVQELETELRSFPDNQAAQDLMAKVQVIEPATIATATTTATPQAPEQKTSDLDKVIPAEICNDEFYNTIVELSQRENLQHVLEIGSSCGTGSTQAFVTGLSKNPAKPSLYCLELSKPRFEELRKSLSSHSFAHCLNASSVPVETFPSPEQVGQFYHRVKTALNDYPLERVLGWLTQDIDYVRSSGSPCNGIEQIKEKYGVKSFDLVLIDGSEFTGHAELNQTYGASWILLDDVRGFKNYDNYQRLKKDAHYQLWRENWSVRNGYAVFKRVQQVAPINFFTIVLNGMPFLTHHIDEFRKLSVPWHWHVVEGVAELKHDTAWSVAAGGKVPGGFDKNGRSIDGTTQYLNELATLFPENVTIYRKPEGARWDGKLEMVLAPLQNIKTASILWQLDSDELWTAAAIEAMHQKFAKDPSRTAAYVHCDYFVGPNKYVSSMNSWATGDKDWLRVWKFIPGMRWGAHEPPILVDPSGKNIAQINPITRDETKQDGLTFQHYSYVTPEQVKFKESYYGYNDAFQKWQNLQQASGPVDPAQFLPWAGHAVVEEWKDEKGPRLGDRYLSKATGPTAYRSMSTNSGGHFETELRKLFERIRPRKIIETGTYKGQGTTSIIWRALRDFRIPYDFSTIEVNPGNHGDAANHFRAQGMAINSMLGLSLPRNLLPSKEQIFSEFVRHKEFNGIYYDHDEAERDKLYFAETDFNVPDSLLYRVLESHNFAPDFVLLDSAGHLGFAEFQYLLQHLKAPCYLMLDDVYHCKHYKSLQVIKQDPRFSLVVESPEKFGFCIAHFTPLKAPQLDSGSTKSTVANPSTTHGVRSIVFMRTDSIGDAVLAASMLKPLAEKYPGAEITVVCKDHIAELYQSSPYVHSVLSLNYDRALTDQGYLDALVVQVRALKADLLINSLYSREIVSELIAVQSEIPQRITLRGDCSNIDPELVAKTSTMYTRVIETNAENKVELQRHQELLSALGIESPAIAPTIWITKDDERFAEELFARHGLNPATTICIGAGTQWDLKVYPNFGHALSLVSELSGFKFLALGDIKEKNLCGDLISCLGGRGINVAGSMSLRQSAAVIKKSKFLVASDSSLAHIACAVGTPNLVVLGGGHFGRFFPYSALTSVVCLPLECYGCNWKCAHERVHCVKDIAPESIAEALRRSLQERTNQPRIFVQSKVPYTSGPKALGVVPQNVGIPPGCSIITL